MADDDRKEATLADGTRVSLRPMAGGDERRMREFLASLPQEDRDFLVYDVTRTEVFELLRAGSGPLGYEGARLVVAEIEGEVAGVGLLRRHSPEWNAHVGEMWLMVGERFRRRGLGRLVAGEVFSLAVELGLEKVLAQMTSDHEAAIEVFRRLGFDEEGRLTGYVRGANGRKRDLVLMASNVEEFLSRFRYLGLPEAFESEWPAPR